MIFFKEVKYLRLAQATWDARTQVLIDFPAWQNLVSQKLETLLDGIEQIDVKLNKIDKGVEANSSKLDKLIEMLSIVMQRQNLSTRLKPSDEFTQHNSQSLKLIQQAAAEFKLLPKNNPNYTQVSMMLGSALSSTGELKQAERLFNEVLEKSSVKAERALAHFNLFQVQLRNKDYAKSIQHLQKASY